MLQPLQPLVSGFFNLVSPCATPLWPYSILLNLISSYFICLQSLFYLVLKYALVQCFYTNILVIPEIQISRTFLFIYGIQNMMEVSTAFLLRKILLMESKWPCISQIQYRLITRIFVPPLLSQKLSQKKKSKRYLIANSLSLSLSIYLSLCVSVFP